MFSNPGSKMKVFGIVVFILNSIILTVFLVLGIISFASVISASHNYYSSRYYSSYSSTNAAAVWGIIGSIIFYLIMEVFNYILCMFIISYGELVQNSTDTLYYIKAIAVKDGAVPSLPQAAVTPAAPVAPVISPAPVYAPNLQTKICPKCGTENTGNDVFCCNCGTRLP